MWGALRSPWRRARRCGEQKLERSRRPAVLGKAQVAETVGRRPRGGVTLSSLLSRKARVWRERPRKPGKELRGEREQVSSESRRAHGREAVSLFPASVHRPR